MFSIFLAIRTINYFVMPKNTVFVDSLGFATQYNISILDSRLIAASVADELLMFWFFDWDFDLF